MSFRAVVLFAVVAFTAVHAWGDAAPAPAKLPAPDPSWVATATKGIKTLYADDFTKAKNIEEKQALGHKLIVAGTAETDSTGRFALLSLARDTAADAGDFVTAFNAIDELDQGYQVDVGKMSITAATAASRGIVWVGQRRLFIQSVRPMVNRAMLADEYDDATQLCTLLTTAAQGIDEDVVKWAASKSQQAKQSAAAMKTMKPALDALRASPDDAEANLKVGKFKCFIKGDWENGLPLLAKGSDADLKSAAAADIKGASGDDPSVVATQQIAIGDAWFDLAEKEKTPADKKAIEARAHKWYSRAMPIAAPADRGKISKRLTQMHSGSAEEPAATMTHSEDILGLMLGTPQPITLQDGVAVLTASERLSTDKAVPLPATFDVICQTDSDDLCFTYVADQITFAHGPDRKELELAGGLTGPVRMMGAGFVPPNQWVEIEFAVTAKSMALSVDGKLRWSIQKDFSALHMKFRVFPSNGSVVKVKSVIMTKPE